MLVKNEEGLIGVSEYIERLREEITLVAKKIKDQNIPVLIEGETGTGKELIAKEISRHSKIPLMPVNCAAIPMNLVESELFGYVKGAFTGAAKSKKGKFELAQNKILFLDEIGELCLEIQAKLLRVLQEGTFSPVGSETEKIISNLRIITATNKNLQKEVKEGNFRKDLLNRINHRIMRTKSLKGRYEDIVTFVNMYKIKNNINIGSRVKFLLYSYNYPDNMRSLISLLANGDEYNYVKRTLKDYIANLIDIDYEILHRIDSIKAWNEYRYYNRNFEFDDTKLYISAEGMIENKLNQN
jgi:transcriptional regulator with GAF, ATPase, and Fis domain